MKINDLPWPTSTREAIELQIELAGQLVLKGDPGSVDLVGGVDVSSSSGSPVMVGAVVVWSISKGVLVDRVIERAATNFPYIPGLLAFRELPVLVKALRELQTIPDVLICDGQGTAHQRGFGIACHLGLYIDIPTIGCGKSKLVGTYNEPAQKKGSVSPLSYRGKEVGRVLRTRDNVKPVFVSAGNRVTHDKSAELILSACSKYRLPDPVRAAHNLAGGKLS